MTTTATYTAYIDTDVGRFHFSADLHLATGTVSDADEDEVKFRAAQLLDLLKAALDDETRRIAYIQSIVNRAGVIHKKVRFKGEVYWLHSLTDAPEDALLAPLDHYNEVGALQVSPFTRVSYAAAHGQNLIRYGKVIGTLADLEDVP